jgi:predicted MFS family arabinose efflux permease
VPIGTGTRRSIWQEAAEGVRFVLAHPYLRLTLPAGMVNNLCVSALQAVLVLYMTDGLGLPPAVIGLLFTAVGVGALVGTLAAAPLSRRVGPGPASVGAALVLVVAFACVPLAGLWPSAAVPLLLGHLFLQPLGLLLLVVTSGSIWQAVTPDHLLGRVNGTRRVVMWATPPIGALLGGAVGSAFGLWAITVAAAVGSLGVLLFVALGAAMLDGLAAASGR